MIQFKRGETKHWKARNEILGAGQPGYDKVRHKIKIGDGKTGWNKLPFASGLSEKEVLDSEVSAKERLTKDSDDKTIFTYGKSVPDKDIVGKVYLQYYKAEPETDYVIEQGASGIWKYQKMHSGIARCWGSFPLKTEVKNNFEGSTLYYDSTTMKQIKYPFAFKDTPNEVASLQSPGGFAWLASRGKNSKTLSGLYSVISLDKLSNASYIICIQVTGFWR